MLEHVDSHAQLATLSKTVVWCRGCDQDGHRFSEWTGPNFDPYPMTETPWCFSIGGFICFIIPTLGSCKFQYSLAPGQVLGLFDMLTQYLKNIYIYIYIYIYDAKSQSQECVFLPKKKQHLCHGQNMGYAPIQGDGHHQSIIRHWCTQALGESPIQNDGGPSVCQLFWCVSQQGMDVKQDMYGPMLGVAVPVNTLW